MANNQKPKGAANSGVGSTNPSESITPEPQKAGAAPDSGTQTTVIKTLTVPEGRKAPKDINAAVYLDQMQKMTEEQLAKKPKVSFIIPLGEGEAEGAFEIVNLNGYQLTIKKGDYVEIPKPIADLLAAHYRINMTAGREYRLDGNRSKDGIRVADALKGR